MTKHWSEMTIMEIDERDSGKAPSPEPAAKTELTAEELELLRVQCKDSAATNYWVGLNPAQVLRLLDEHAAMRKEIVNLEHRIKGLQQSAICEREQRQRAENAESRIAELETALALATEAVATEALAKVEGLTCTREERAVLDAIPARADELGWLSNQVFGTPWSLFVDAIRAARREAAKAKGDT